MKMCPQVPREKFVITQPTQQCSYVHNLSTFLCRKLPSLGPEKILSKKSWMSEKEGQLRGALWDNPDFREPKGILPGKHTLSWLSRQCGAGRFARQYTTDTYNDFSTSSLACS